MYLDYRHRLKNTKRPVFNILSGNKDFRKNDSPRTYKFNLKLGEVKIWLVLLQFSHRVLSNQQDSAIIGNFN
jgi:hypothetical protein